MTDLIYQYTQGNMLACAQVIDKIALSHPPNSQINIEQVQEQLSNQCEHSPFELIDACLLGQADKSIQILRQAANNKTGYSLQTTQGVDPWAGNISLCKIPELKGGSPSTILP